MVRRDGATYQTQYTDPTTGDVLMQSRWYSPGTATFRSRDTWDGNLNTPVSLNRYTYANNPVRYSDPTGYCADLASIVLIVESGLLVATANDQDPDHQASRAVPPPFEPESLLQRKRRVFKTGGLA